MVSPSRPPDTRPDVPAVARAGANWDGAVQPQREMTGRPPFALIVMGVSGSGKSTLGVQLAADLSWEEMSLELAGRPSATRARTGNLLQGMRPDLADAIRESSPLHGKTWFGPRGHLRRHDNVWQVADTSLPFDPRTLRAAA